MALVDHVLVIGGQRSGKSRFAEELVMKCGHKPVYIATATAGDEEMRARIAEHRSRRGDLWETLEAPLELAATLAAASGKGVAVLVDCLTLWLSNLIAAEQDIDRSSQALIATLADAAGPVVLVSNEVGCGVIPENALARRYADALGTLNQRVAEAVGRVVLVAAGRPLLLKPSPCQEIIL